MGKHLINWLAIALVSSLSVAISYHLWNTRTTKVQNPKVAPVNLSVSSVVALGRLEPQGKITRVSAPTTIDGTRMRVTKLLVKEGDRVQAGQIIARLDVYERYQAALELATKQLNVAQAQLQKSRSTSGETAAQQARIARLKTELDTAKTEYQRYQELFQEGAISASLLDSKQLVVSNVQGQLDEAKATLEQLRDTHKANEQLAQAEVESAIAAVARTKADLNLADVKAPIAGQILEIHTRSGEVVSEQGIVELGQTNQMLVVAEIYETDIGRVQLGSRAIIISSGFTDELHGNVEQIGLKIGKQAILDTDPIADEDARVVEVKIRLDPKDSQRVATLTNLRVKVEI
ncbi:HlyD family efflux transporter periplasmic adaptor subunit [Komarekiella sp. 'clone 1']|uniref:HlyD family efflux transporter periplasmic adaptor subunit n=2 Tax=Komarekiella TaxID=2022127 RepID=A0AA40T323_9NOST|nr:HlyD family efflux transporter periplasmic adaptor subunit [Komarekiella delphini-convector SJRDD-AB1]